MEWVVGIAILGRVFAPFAMHDVTYSSEGTSYLASKPCPCAPAKVSKLAPAYETACGNGRGYSTSYNYGFHTPTWSKGGHNHSWSK